MDNEQIIGRIDELVAEERALRTRAVGAGLTDAEHARLGLLETQLDQCWDLLRRRRAQTEFGADPDAAQARSVSEVESYRQ